MSSPGLKMPKIIYSKNHETVTWNVWIKHKISCKICIHGGEKVSTCLEGANAHEEWLIAMNRLKDLLP